MLPLLRKFRPKAIETDMRGTQSSEQVRTGAKLIGHSIFLSTQGNQGLDKTWLSLEPLLYNEVKSGKFIYDFFVIR